MHHALSLPEVVSAILLTQSPLETGSNSFLYNCLLVNYLFSLEATRILWHACGSGRQTSPKIRDLVLIILRDAARAQFYAKFIRALFFGSEVDVSEWCIDTSTDEVRYHKILSRIEFPALESIVLSGTLQSKWFNTPNAILHYIQPSLKELRLDVGLEIPDSFLSALAAKAPKLQRLSIRVWEDALFSSWSDGVAEEQIEDDSDNELVESISSSDTGTDVTDEERRAEKIDGGKIMDPLKILLGSENIEQYTKHNRRDTPQPRPSENALIKLIDELPWLSELIICRVDLGAAWSVKALKKMSAHPHLKTLWVPAIPYDWVSQLEQARPLQVDDLRTSVSTVNLAGLIPFLSNVTSLTLSFLAVEDPILPLVVKLSNLISFSLDSTGNEITVTAEDLILLSRGCPKLEKLELPSSMTGRILNDDVSDSTIKEFAQNLPDLRQIRLQMHRPNLTHLSFFYLAGSCTNLENCHLAADVSFRTVAKQSTGMFESLRFVTFTLPQYGREFEANPNQLAEKLKAAMPNVVRFHLVGGTLSDMALKDALAAW